MRKVIRFLTNAQTLEWAVLLEIRSSWEASGRILSFDGKVVELEGVSNLIQVEDITWIGIA